MKKQFLEAGKITGPHGLRGEMRIDPWCDGPEFLVQFDRFYLKDQRQLEVESAKVHKNVVIVKLKGVDTVEQTQQLRNKVVYIDRDDVQLPEGVYFVQDLIGLQAIDEENGTVYGTVAEVFQTGANDVYRITNQGRDYYVPKIPDVVRRIDLDQGFVLINTSIVKGIFNDEN